MERHLIVFQESANGIHQEILGLHNPSNNIAQSHPYNWQPASNGQGKKNPWYQSSSKKNITKPTSE